MLPFLVVPLITALVTRNGQAFAFGSGNYGQLGDGRSNFHNIGIPQRIALPDGLVVASISCGRWHTALVTQDGQAFAFGDGDHGKLGDGRTGDNDIGIPQRIVLPDGLVVAFITCSESHTALVTQNGQAFAFGDGEHGRLGDGRTDDHNVGIPQPIALPDGLLVASISCGTWHTALVTVAKENDPTLLPIECAVCGQPAQYISASTDCPRAVCGQKCQYQFYNTYY